MKLMHPAHINIKPIQGPDYFTGPISWWTNSLTCGGVERQIVATSRALRDKYCKLTLLCNRIALNNAFFLTEAKNSFFSIVDFSKCMIDKKVFLSAKYIASSLYFLKDTCIDTIAAYASLFFSVRPRMLQIWNADFVEPIIAAAVVGIPRIVIAGRSLSPAQRAPYGFESIDEKLAFAILHCIMQSPNIVMTNNSRAGCKAYEDWLGLPAGTVSYTPNICDLEQWEVPGAERIAQLRQRLGIPEGAPVLGGLFRFVSIKDPELWVSTALRACAANPNLYAVVGGDGPGWAPIRQRIAQTSFAKRVIFPGRIKDVSAFLSLCSVFLHTAHVEGLPNVILEAQAYAVPVVTTKCGGATDIVIHGESGFIVEDREDIVLSQYVQKLVNNTKLAKAMGRAGRLRIANEFSKEKSLAKLMAVYERLVTIPSGDKQRHCGVV